MVNMVFYLDQGKIQKNVKLFLALKNRRRHFGDFALAQQAQAPERFYKILKVDESSKEHIFDQI